MTPKRWTPKSQNDPPIGCRMCLGRFPGRPMVPGGLMQGRPGESRGLPGAPSGPSRAIVRGQSADPWSSVLEPLYGGRFTFPPTPLPRGPPPDLCKNHCKTQHICTKCGFSPTGGVPSDPPRSSRKYAPPPSWGTKMVTVIRIEHFWPPRAHPDWRGLTQLGSYWPRFAQMGPDWFRLTQIRPYGFRLLGLYWPRFAQIGPYGPRLVQIGPDSGSRLAQIGPY